MVDPEAAIEISAFRWVPDFAKGVVRDLRVRWALEEAGLAYRERLLDAMTGRPDDYLLEQPFGQVPIFVEGDVHLFESGAIVLHIGHRSETLLPREALARDRAVCWVIAALNSVEPLIMELNSIDIFNADAEWARLRRPGAVQMIQQRLGRLSQWLGDKDYLEGDFTAGDLLMSTVLRNLRHTDILAGYPNLTAYRARCEARPAFQRALQAQLQAFEGHAPATAA
jgi:glutathione S-transferase